MRLDEIYRAKDYKDRTVGKSSTPGSDTRDEEDVGIIGGRRGNLFRGVKKGSKDSDSDFFLVPPVARANFGKRATTTGQKVVVPKSQKGANTKVTTKATGQQTNTSVKTQPKGATSAAAAAGSTTGEKEEFMRRKNAEIAKQRVAAANEAKRLKDLEQARVEASEAETKAKAAAAQAKKEAEEKATRKKLKAAEEARVNASKAEAAARAAEKAEAEAKAHRQQQLEIKRMQDAADEAEAKREKARVEAENAKKAADEAEAKRLKDAEAGRVKASADEAKFKQLEAEAKLKAAEELALKRRQEAEAQRLKTEEDRARYEADKAAKAAEEAKIKANAEKSKKARLEWEKAKLEAEQKRLEFEDAEKAKRIAAEEAKAETKRLEDEHNKRVENEKARVKAGTDQAEAENAKIKIAAEAQRLKDLENARVKASNDQAKAEEEIKKAEQAKKAAKKAGDLKKFRTAEMASRAAYEEYRLAEEELKRVAAAEAEEKKKLEDEKNKKAEAEKNKKAEAEKNTKPQPKLEELEKRLADEQRKLEELQKQRVKTGTTGGTVHNPELEKQISDAQKRVDDANEKLKNLKASGTKPKTTPTKTGTVVELNPDQKLIDANEKLKTELKTVKDPSRIAQINKEIDNNQKTIDKNVAERNKAAELTNKHIRTTALDTPPDEELKPTDSDADKKIVKNKAELRYEAERKAYKEAYDEAIEAGKGSRSAKKYAEWRARATVEMRAINEVLDRFDKVINDPTASDATKDSARRLKKLYMDNNDTRWKLDSEKNRFSLDADVDDLDKDGKMPKVMGWKGRMAFGMINLALLGYDAYQIYGLYKHFDDMSPEDLARADYGNGYKSVAEAVASEIDYAFTGGYVQGLKAFIQSPVSDIVPGWDVPDSELTPSQLEARQNMKWYYDRQKIQNQQKFKPKLGDHWDSKNDPTGQKFYDKHGYWYPNTGLGYTLDEKGKPLKQSKVEWKWVLNPNTGYEERVPANWSDAEIETNFRLQKEYSPDTEIGGTFDQIEALVKRDTIIADELSKIDKELNELSKTSGTVKTRIELNKRAKRRKELKRKQKALKRERRENQREKDRLKKEGQED